MRNSLSLLNFLQMGNCVFVKGSLRETDFAHKRVCSLIKAINFGCAIDTKVMLAEEDKQIFWSSITN